MSSQWFNLEFCALELTHTELVFDNGVERRAAAAAAGGGLPASWGSDERWGAGSDDAPGGWAESLLEGVHDDRAGLVGAGLVLSVIQVAIVSMLFVGEMIANQIRLEEILKKVHPVPS